MNSGSVEWASWDFFLHLFKNYVHHHLIFPKINKGGGLEWKQGVGEFFKINKWGDDYSVHKSMLLSAELRQTFELLLTICLQTKIPMKICSCPKLLKLSIVI